MRIRGGQDMSTAPNSLLVEGNVLLTRSLYNGNSNHPPQISQYGFPFPFRPNHGDGFSVPILPNLNSFPEMTGNIGMIEPMCIPQTPITLDKNRRIQDRDPHEVIDLFNECVTNTAIGVSETRKAPPTPIALDKNKRLQDRLPREAIDLVNEIQTGRNEMGVWRPVAKDPAGLFFTKPVTPQMVSFQPQELDMNLVRPTEGVSVQQSEIGEHGERGTQDIDLNKTPQQKPRRKKHRPKVIREGKSARTPKPVTPKPVTPKPERNKETPSGKRKYVRKNKVMSPSDNPSGPALETVYRDSGSGTKSVRRCLNFDSQEPQARDVNPGSSSMFAHDTVTQARDACISGTVTSSTTKSAMPCVQSQEVLENNSPSRFPFDLNTSMNNISSGYIRIPESMPPPYRPSRRELQINSLENGYIGVSTNSPPIPQTRRENIRVNLKEFARKIEHWKVAGNSLGSQEAGQKSHLDSNNSLDVLLGGIKRNHSLVDDARMSALKNFMHAFKRTDQVSGNHGHDQYFPEIIKKRRMEEQREFTYPGSSVVTCSPSSWNTSLAMPNNDQVFNSGDVQGTMPSTRSRLLVPRSCHLFTFAEAQRLVALEKLRASEHNNSSNNRNANTSATVKPSIYISKDYIHPSTPEKVSARKDIQGNKIYIPQNRVEALPVNNNVESKNTKCTKKEQVCLAKAMNSNTKKVHLQEHGAASYSYGSAVSEKFKDRDSCLQISFIQEGQKNRNSRELHRGVSVSSAVVTFVDSIDDLVRKLRHLNLNDAHEIVKETEEQKALVPYAGGGGTVVPYEGPFDPSKRRRPRPKVDLDQESHRVWKVLMGKESVDEGIDADKEKWWQEERIMFRGRVDSFIARMHLVQGDRRFSRWKGSVVDSVVGVFLTQNVSDHLSSSAFMSLAARFPLKPKGNCSKLSAESIGAFTEPQNGCIIDLDDGIKWQESILSKKLSSHGPLFVSEEKEISRSNELLGINTVDGTIDNSEAKVSDLDENEREVSHESADNTATTSATMTGGTSIADADDRRSMEDVVSSQGSVVSSQNSFGCQVQTLDQMNPNSILYFHAEDSMNGGMCNGLDSSTSFTELLQMAESTRFKELYSHGNGRVSPMEQCEATENLACPEVDLRARIPSQSGYADGNHPSVWRPNSHQHDIPSVLFTSSSSKSIVTKSTNTIRENNSSHLPSTVSGMNITNTMRNTDQRCGPSEESCTRAMSQPFRDFLTSSYTRLIGNVSGVREESSSLFASTASGMNNINNVKMLSSRNSSNEAMGQHDLVGSSCTPSVSYNLQNFSNTGLMSMGGSNAERVGSNPHLPSTASGLIGQRYGSSSENSTDYIDQHVMHTLKEPPMIGTCEPTWKHSVPPSTNAKAESCVDKCSFTQSSIQKERNEASSDESTLHICSNLPDEQTSKFQKKETGVESQVKGNEQAVRAQAQMQNGPQAQMQNGRIHQTFQKPANSLKANSEVVKAVELDLKDKVHSSQKVSATTMERASKGSKEKKAKAEAKTYDWDKLRKQACANSAKIERSSDNMDSIDWEAVRSADVKEIADTIRERGMNNMLAERIKEFLNRLVKDHGSIDLEWLRDVPSDITKDYLLSIRGLGLKSVECVRLLTLHHLAFPVDTNVGRICVRLGWVPLQPLPESLQLHLLEMYPVLETIQKYLWPRLCKLDQRTLYELHYQLITFGKVFCTKSKPNCNACPMRAECKHFASAYASSRLALPGPEGKGLVSLTTPIASEPRRAPVFSPMPLPQLEGSTYSHEGITRNNCEPIIEEPTTPEPEEREILERDIEDAFYEDPDEIPHIELNLEQFSQNLQSYMQENKMELQDVDMSKALVAITPEAASIPMPKLKNVSNLRTEHLVYQLPDSHPLLEALDEREADDPSPYLLAIWSPGETAQSTEPPKAYCDCQGSGKFCDKATCFACNSLREAQAQTVRGTLLIPCRTAMRGSFPLNGTYFQVNEMFADHDSSCEPINVPRTLLWNLPRRTVYFGTSIPTIFKGLTTEGIQHCFWRGFVCVRGFDRTTRAPRPLYARLHFPVSKAPRNKRNQQQLEKRNKSAEIQPS